MSKSNKAKILLGLVISAGTGIYASVNGLHTCIKSLHQQNIILANETAADKENDRQLEAAEKTGKPLDVVLVHVDRREINDSAMLALTDQTEKNVLGGGEVVAGMVAFAIFGAINSARKEQKIRSSVEFMRTN